MGKRWRRKGEDDNWERDSEDNEMLTIGEEIGKEGEDDTEKENMKEKERRK